MVIVSKRRVSDDVLEKIYKLFFEIVIRSSSRNAFFEVIDEIFSPVEKLMIAKRIGIIYLLTKNVDQSKIAEVLKVSTSTVNKYYLAFNNKDSVLKNLLKNMSHKEKVLGFLEDVFADLLIQPGLKIGHWKLYNQHRNRKLRRKTF